MSGVVLSGLLSQAEESKQVPSAHKKRRTLLREVSRRLSQPANGSSVSAQMISGRTDWLPFVCLG